MATPTVAPIFQNQYPDNRPAAATALERVEVDKQAKHLTQLNGNAVYLDKVYQSLTGRRTKRPDLVQFERIAGAGIPTLVVTGELLVSRADLDLPAVQKLIRDLGLEQQPVAGVDKIVRLVERETDPSRTILRGRMNEVLKDVSSRKAPVSPNYIPVLGVVMKGEGGPEPSAGGRPFPSVTIGGSGGPVPVAVVDTGITGLTRTDGWLQGLLTGTNEDQLDVIPAPDLSLDLAAGHGTFAAGVLQQVAPTADIRMLLGMDTDGIGQETTVASQIVAAVQGGAKILSLSFGTRTAGDVAPVALRAALQTAFGIDPDLLVVAAAGNFGDTRPCWPAAFSQEFPNVVAVAALTASGAPAAWSSHGSWVTCSAIGQGVVSTYVHGTENVLVENPPDTFAPPNPWASWTGTSFAAPQVAGAVARKCQENPGMKPHDALGALLNQGTAIPDYGKAMIILPGT